MEYRSLGKSGPKVSAVGLGAWQWGSRGYWRYGDCYSKEDLISIVAAARASGVNLIDTAEVYGRGESERLIGELVPKDEFLIATKYLPLAVSASAVERHLGRSLRRLGRSSVDLYQVHWHNPLLSLRGTMRCLEAMVRKGKIGHIGVSNFDVPTLRRAREFLSTTDIVSNQVRYNLLNRGRESDGTIDYCRREGIAILAWSPLEQGILTGKFPPGTKVRGWRRANRFFRQSSLVRAKSLTDVLKAVSEAHGRAPSQGALAWILRQDNVIVIPGASKAEHVLTNAGGSGWYFDERELEVLDTAYRRFLG